MTEEVLNEQAESRDRYLNLCVDMGQIVNEQIDEIISLRAENKQLRREIWHLKQTKRRK